MDVWILTSEYNDYDQHGVYFEAVFKCKPTVEQLKDRLHCNDSLAEHILTGGGRTNRWEDMWYWLAKEPAL